MCLCREMDQATLSFPLRQFDKLFLNTHVCIGNYLGKAPNPSQRFIDEDIQKEQEPSIGSQFLQSASN